MPKFDSDRWLQYRHTEVGEHVATPPAVQAGAAGSDGGASSSAGAVAAPLQVTVEPLTEAEAEQLLQTGQRRMPKLLAQGDASAESWLAL